MRFPCVAVVRRMQTWWLSLIVLLSIDSMGCASTADVPIYVPEQGPVAGCEASYSPDGQGLMPGEAAVAVRRFNACSALSFALSDYRHTKSDSAAATVAVRLQRAREAGCGPRVLDVARADDVDRQSLEPAPGWNNGPGVPADVTIRVLQP